MPVVRLFIVTFVLASATPASAMSLMPAVDIPSPDGRLVVQVRVESGRPVYVASLDGKPVLGVSHLGVVRDDADFTQGLTTTANYSKRVDTEKVDDRYELLTSKRRSGVYRANRRTLELQTSSGARIDIVFQVSNDGFAFRYVFPETDATVRK